MTREYADFEWPWGNLGLLLIRRGEIEKAQETLNKALDLNADYFKAWLHLARAKAVVLELAGARKCVEKALALNPQDGGAKTLLEVINLLSSL